MDAQTEPVPECELFSRRTIYWRIEKFDMVLANEALINSQEYEFDLEGGYEMPLTSWKLFLKVQAGWGYDRSIQLCYIPKDSSGDRPDLWFGPSKTIIHKAFASIISRYGDVSRSSVGPLGAHRVEVNCGRVLNAAPACIMEFPMAADKLTLVNGNLILSVTIQFYRPRNLENPI